MTGGISRTGLAKELGLSQMAMSRIVRDLFDAGLVEECGDETHENGPGRRQRLLRIRPYGAYSAGIVLSAYSNDICIVAANGNVLHNKTIPVKNIANGKATARKLSKALNQLIDKHNIPRQHIVGVGIAVAAQLDVANQSVVSSHLLGWKPFNLVEEVSNITGLPAYAESIVNALTLAEVTIGTIQKKENIIVVRSATTMAASILQHGQLVRGKTQLAGRMGHFQVAKSKLCCSCGSNSCLNCWASGWSVLANLGKTKDGQYNVEHLDAYAQEINALIEAQSDPISRNKKTTNQARVIQEAGAELARSLTQLNQFLEPQAIVLYGSMSRLNDYRQGIAKRLESSEEGKLALDKIRYGELNSVRAAGLLALKETVYSPTLDFEQIVESANITNYAKTVGDCH